MPFPMKIQPIDFLEPIVSVRNDPVKPAAKSRFKRLFERQLPSVLRISSVEKAGVGEQQQYNKDSGNDWEPSSVCLDKMVQNFIEEGSEKQSSSSKCARNRCNCFNANDGSDDEFEIVGGCGESMTSGSSGEACEILKSLVPCASVSERNLLADTAKIVEKNKICKRKDDCRKIVTDGLLALGYDASICKSRWEKCPSYPAGEYEYVDVIVEGERLLVDIDFRSEFEIARSTGNYRTVLQSLPSIFVGKPDRLQQIICILSEAAKQSLKKTGMHFPPWRKAEYMISKWLSPYTRTTSSIKPNESEINTKVETEEKPCLITTKEDFSGDFELIFGEKSSSSAESESSEFASSQAQNSGKEDEITVAVLEWKPPAIKPKNSQRGTQIVTGLASVLKEKP